MGLDISFALDSIKTQQKRELTEKALLESEKNYRELVDNSLGRQKTNYVVTYCLSIRPWPIYCTLIVLTS